MDIEEFLNNLKNEQKERIGNETNNIVNEIKEKKIKEIDEKYRNALLLETVKYDEDYKSYLLKFNNNLKVEEESKKMKALDNLFLKVLDNLNNLDKNNLLNFVVKLVSPYISELDSNINILVSKNRFDKYYEAFTKDNECDLLEEKFPNKNFKLKLAKDDIKYGFIINCKDYDLIFDFYQIIMDYKKENISKIYDKVFNGNG